MSWHSRLIWVILTVYCLTMGAYRDARGAWLGRTVGLGILVAAGLTVFLAARRPDLVTWAAVAVNGLLVAGVPLLAGVVARGSRRAGPRSHRSERLRRHGGNREPSATPRGGLCYLVNRSWLIDI